MAAPRTSRARRAPAPAPTCGDCNGSGETTETVRVGTRKLRETDDRQAALCLTCMGTGEAPAG
ncbi:hypothetical protein GPJ59_18070 [Streptomyces bambusae]|uniref:Molecular chaperone DnaJ n=1 Tax=Streptomyces bambusae TaxID=1550616 RepID=A0ABS6ZAI7_9ACTN|nr:hypothetical protein [Streptomyces bambusae]